MSYIDGFVVPVPKKKLDAYRRMSVAAGKVWREFGALEYRECVAEELSQKGAVTFPRSVKAKKGETVVFSWITYKSRAHRDRIVGKVMKDPRIAALCDPAKSPFDWKRMLYGGFKTFVEV